MSANACGEVLRKYSKGKLNRQLESAAQRAVYIAHEFANSWALYTVRELPIVRPLFSLPGSCS